MGHVVKACSNARRYKAKVAPRCNNGDQCESCRAKWAARPKSVRGNCYVTSEALYYLLGGKYGGWTPMTMKHEGATHWFLKHSSGLILDATNAQFGKDPDYSKARGRGFLTGFPSRRAKELMKTLVWQWE